VVRCFPEGEIIHVEQGIDPVRDIGIINTELILKDLDTVEKRLQKLESEAKTGDKSKAKDLEIMRKVHQALDSGVLLHNLDKQLIGEAVVRELNLLTAKSQIYLLNGNKSDITEGLVAEIKRLNADYLVFDLGGQPDLNELIRKAYEVLGLISFFTTGEDETRSWTIERGEKAPQAAGTIHTDFENKFIRAEVVNWEKLLEAGSWVAAKHKGWLRLEGKEYVVQDGDVVEIRHG
jgi:ribosome-binding ATPase YchF (GTP1/OBG family)